MSFSDLAWEEKAPGRSKRRLHRDFEFSIDRTEVHGSLPDWEEVSTPVQRKVARLDFFDTLTIAGYLVASLFFLGVALVAVFDSEHDWIFLKVLCSMVMLFMAVGRIIEVRWRARNDH